MKHSRRRDNSRHTSRRRFDPDKIRHMTLRSGNARRVEHDEREPKVYVVRLKINRKIKTFCLNEKKLFFPKTTNRISIKLRFSAGSRGLKNRLEDRDERFVPIFRKRPTASF